MGLPLLVALAIVFGGFAAFIGARYAVMRRAGATRLREGLFITRERWDAASPLLKVGFLVAGPLAMYLLCVVVFFTGSRLAGEQRVSEQAEVEVVPGAPASRAGIQDGDRIVSVNGAPVVHFQELSGKVQSAESDDVEIEIERGSERRVIKVVRESRKIGVRPYAKQVEIPVTKALAGAAAAPAKVAAAMVDAFGELFSGPKKSELGGPTRMVAEMKAVREPSVLDGVLMGAAFTSYLMVLLTLFSPLSIPWRKKKKA
ncbi:MAG: PDZ domain-containing protein [Polyangiaceae bacterium]|nr:PDZ domain-containing protein [Polyangiaceae bacterium]